MTEENEDFGFRQLIASYDNASIIETTDKSKQCTLTKAHCILTI